MNIRAYNVPGTVYLVGAGPGDPELITVRGLKLIQSADVLVYDRLVHPSLIDQAPAKTEKIYVGKAPGSPSTSQEDIHVILKAAAARHRCVVRLKGGDPFVFGRGSEEAEALGAAGIRFEIVPGLSSAYAVPAYAGIPMTHRNVARSFMVVTGHTAFEGPDVDWSALMGADTLVILMGMKRIGKIARRLIEAGRSADLPAAVISQGCTDRQQTALATLSTIAEAAKHLSAPAIIVVGEVARLHRTIQWRNKHVEPMQRASFAFTDHVFAISA